jgi:hypothetical protein
VTAARLSLKVGIDVEVRDNTLMGVLEGVPFCEVERALAEIIGCQGSITCGTPY